MFCSFVPNNMNKGMTKKTQKSTDEQKPIRDYYSAIGKACGCSSRYVRMVLTGDLGNYKDRNTPLVKRIHEKSQELTKFFEQ
jgi:hypothetical protein